MHPTQHDPEPTLDRGRIVRAERWPTLRRALWLVLTLALATTWPAGADWLVTRDGHEMQTRGVWRVKGKLIHFTALNGALSSLRLEEVNLEASRALTAERAGDIAPPLTPRPLTRPGLVLRDGDVARATPSPVSPVVIYTTSWCPYCRRARALLGQLGERFDERDIERSPAARREYQAKAGSDTGVPLLVIDGTVIQGFQEARIRQAVKKLQDRRRKAQRAPRGG